MQGSVVSRRLPILSIQYGAQATDSIGMPVAAWILGECLLRWMSTWKSNEVGWHLLGHQQMHLSCQQLLGSTCSFHAAVLSGP